MNKTTMIIFSKNRAMQLENLIFSLIVHWKDFRKQSVKVIYTYTNDEFRKGYDKVMNKYSWIEFIKETAFRQNVIDAIDTGKELLIFGTDDDVFIRNFDLQCEEVNFFKLRLEIITLSLRLGDNIKYCYTQNRMIARPELIQGAKYRLWNWTYQDQGDWTYPFSLDFNLYKTDFILDYLKKFDFRSPNTMEGYFARIMPYAKYLMMGFEKPKLVNLPCNRVQVDNQNRHGKITAEYLNKMYLDGYVIDLDELDIYNRDSCHAETEMKFVKE
jgi:hypothetical protein